MRVSHRGDRGNTVRLKRTAYVLEAGRVPYTSRVLGKSFHQPRCRVLDIRRDLDGKRVCEFVQERSRPPVVNREDDGCPAWRTAATHEVLRGCVAPRETGTRKNQSHPLSQVVLQEL